jgi:hypothetical protein
VGVWLGSWLSWLAEAPVRQGNNHEPPRDAAKLTNRLLDVGHVLEGVDGQHDVHGLVAKRQAPSFCASHIGHEGPCSAASV